MSIHVGPPGGEGIRGIPESQKRVEKPLIQFEPPQVLSPEELKKERNLTEETLKRLVRGNSSQLVSSPVTTEIIFQVTKMKQRAVEVENEGLKLPPIARRKQERPLHWKKIVNLILKPVKLIQLNPMHRNVSDKIENVDSVGKTKDIHFNIIKAIDYHNFSVISQNFTETTHQSELVSLENSYDQIFADLVKEEASLRDEMIAMMDMEDALDYSLLQDLMARRLTVQKGILDHFANTHWEKRILLLEQKWEAEKNKEIDDAAIIERQIEDFDSTFSNKLGEKREMLNKENRELFNKMKEAASHASQAAKLERMTALEKTNYQDEADKTLCILIEQWQMQKSNEALASALFAYQRQLADNPPLIAMTITSDHVGSELDRFVKLLDGEAKNSTWSPKQRFAFKNLHARLEHQVRNKRAALEGTKRHPERQKEVLKDPIRLSVTDSEQKLLEGIMEKHKSNKD